MRWLGRLEISPFDLSIGSRCSGADSVYAGRATGLKFHAEQTQRRRGSSTGS
jgi:hypothetical protein